MIKPNEFPIYTEAFLREPCEPVRDEEHARALYALLEEQFPSKGAFGVACPQIGIHAKASLMRLPGSDDFTFMCNPEIVSQEDEFVFAGEGCLSFPRDFRNTVRFKRVTVKYRNENFEERTAMAENIEAVIFQHEVDHLNGILFVDRAHPIHLEQAGAKKKKYDRRNKTNVGSRAV